jgi:uncharacterized membrane protein YfcA
MATHLLFLLFVAVAVYAQSLTGFALALILLGLVGVTDLVPITDAVNAVTVMVVVNALTFGYRRWPLRLERSLWPALGASLVGAIAGIVLLTWLAGTAYQLLRLLLGLSIVGCALLLWSVASPLAATSPTRSFLCVGGMSGVLGGLFSAPGPPLVYLVYRQPWPAERVQESLILFFGVGALLRLAIVVPSGHFSADAVQLAVEALPVVFLVTAFAAGRPVPLPPRVLKAMVCLLLVATGAGMTAAAMSALSA